MSARQVLSVHPAIREDIGDLITRRPVPAQGLEQVDPFLFLNHHGPQTYPPGNRGLPFGPHPHRGFETVTFILQGNLAHRDTGGGESIVEAGGVQWMTAGRGLIHAELSPKSFKREGGLLEILQLWINLPADKKMVEPNYVGVAAEEIPARQLAQGVTMRPVSGTQGAPVQSITGVMLATVEMEAGASASLPAPRERSVFFYTVRGAARIGEIDVPEHHLAQVTDGDRLQISSEAGCCILYGHADPIAEPVVAHGPFVMNTREEIAQAVQDYQRGTFGDPSALR